MVSLGGGKEGEREMKLRGGVPNIYPLQGPNARESGARENIMRYECCISQEKMKKEENARSVTAKRREQEKNRSITVIPRLVTAQHKRDQGILCCTNPTSIRKNHESTNEVGKPNDS